MNIKKLNLTTSILTICVALFHLYRSINHFFILEEVEKTLSLSWIVTSYLILSILIFILAIASFGKREYLVFFLGICLIALSFGDFLFSIKILSFTPKTPPFDWNYEVNILERIFYWILAFGFFRRSVIKISQQRRHKNLIINKF